MLDTALTIANCVLLAFSVLGALWSADTSWRVVYWIMTFLLSQALWMEAVLYAAGLT